MLWPLCVSVALAFEVEPWLVNLTHYGPFPGTPWEPHPMNLIGDYEYTLERFSARGGDEFLFVALLNSTPPLGNLNWKQGKLGVWGTDHLEPGGGSGRYPVTGIYSISLITPQSRYTPSTLNLILIEATAVSVSIQASRFLNLNRTMNLSITFGEKVVGFGLSHLQTKSAGEVVLSDLFDHGIAPDGKRHLFSVLAAPTKTGLVTVFIEEGAVNSTSGPSEFFSCSFLHNPLLDQGTWTPSVLLRDSSNRFKPDQQPPGGWHVTPIHIVMLPLTGHLLVSGWLRRDELPCLGGPFSGGRRQAGVSFILDPTTLSASPPGFLNISVVDENPEHAFGDTHNDTTQEGHVIDGDAIYCAGHTVLQDGRVFYAGGARYAYISSPFEREYGLDYARLFDPKTKLFTRVNSSMPLGRAWYPTCALLPDGRVLVTGGYSDYATDKCTKPEKCTNPQINIFDPFLYDRGLDPWTVYVNTTYMTHDIDPGVREYTRVFVLPQPVTRGKHKREVLVMGKAGVVYLLALDGAVPMNERMFAPPGGGRPNHCSDQSTAVPLLTNGGELLVMGGCDDDTLQRIDIYNVQKDSWLSFDTGIKRAVPSGFLLPDGTVLLVSGENTRIPQAEYVDTDASQDPRYAQIFDPETRQIRTSSERALRFRGYHNTGAVLRDGSLLLGGGFNQHGDVGCENTDLQIYKPGYFYSGPRPVLSQKSLKGLLEFELASEDSVEFDPSIAVVGVNLLASQAFTHSYGQHQRHIQLSIVKQTRGGVLTIKFPDSPVLFPGIYLMFLISDQGVPSIGVPVQIAIPKPDKNAPSLSAYLWLVALLVVLVLMLAAFVVKPIRKKCCTRRARSPLSDTLMTESVRD